MAKARTFLFITMGLVISVITLQAQKADSAEKKPIYYLGIYADYNRNIHFAEFDELSGIESCCPKFTDGTGHGFAVGGLFELPLNHAMSIELRAGFSVLNGSLITQEDNIGLRVKHIDPPQNIAIEQVDVEYTIDSKLYTAGISPTVNFEFFNNFVMNVGFRLSNLFTARIDHREEIIRPNNVVFLKEDKASRQVFEDMELPNKSSMLFAGVIGFNYKVPIGEYTYLTPEFRYHLQFNDISSVEWKPSTFQFGLALKLPIMPAEKGEVIEEYRYQRDTVIKEVPGLAESQIELMEEKKEVKREKKGIDELVTTIYHEKYEKRVPKDLSIEAGLRVTGITTDGKRTENPQIIIEEFETEEGFPLLPHVFFREASANLQKTKMHLLEPTETDEFSEEYLPWNTLDIYSDLLNIVAKRMKENPEAILTITGCNKDAGIEENNLDLSRERAMAVRDYFMRVWGFSDDRFEIDVRNKPGNPGNIEVVDGQIENQRAELSSYDPDILAPVNLEEVERVANPPQVLIDPTIKADARIKNWVLDVEQEGANIRQWTGSTTPESITWTVGKEPVPKYKTPLKINLTASDVYDNQTSISKQLEIDQLTIRKKRRELRNDSTIERFSLILFDFDKATLKPAQRRVLQDIRERIEPESKVIIKGYADRTGEADYNRELARRRIQNAQRFLGVEENKLETYPIGSDELLYNNDIPEGRGYSRTVQIIIKTPVEE